MRERERERERERRKNKSSYLKSSDYPNLSHRAVFIMSVFSSRVLCDTQKMFFKVFIKRMYNFIRINRLD